MIGPVPQLHRTACFWMRIGEALARHPVHIVNELPNLEEHFVGIDGLTKDVTAVMHGPQTRERHEVMTGKRCCRRAAARGAASVESVRAPTWIELFSCRAPAVERPLVAWGRVQGTGEPARRRPLPTAMPLHRLRERAFARSGTKQDERDECAHRGALVGARHRMSPASYRVDGRRRGAAGRTSRRRAVVPALLSGRRPAHPR